MSAEDQFVNEVFPAELAEILARRQSLDRRDDRPAAAAAREPQPAEGEPEPAVSEGAAARAQQLLRSVASGLESVRHRVVQALMPHAESLPTGPRPSTDHGLVGLALSGGGIRSATFNLGVIQVLARRGVLREVDYLSTVSGGGYIGSTLSSVLSSGEFSKSDAKPPSVEADDFPLDHERGEVESECFKHLRNHSKYLVPRGLPDRLLMLGVVLRGIASNLIAVVPLVIFVVLATDLLFESLTEHGLKQDFQRLHAELSPEPAEPAETTESAEPAEPAESSEPAESAESAAMPPPWEAPWSEYYRLTRWLLFAVALWFGLTLWIQRSSIWASFYSAAVGISRRVRLALGRPAPALDDPVSPLDARDLFRAIFGYLLLGWGTVAFIESQPYAIAYFTHQLLLGGVQSLNDLDVKGAVGELRAWGVMLGSLVPFLFARPASRTLLPEFAAQWVARWTGQATLIGLAMLGPAILYMLYLRLCAWTLLDIPIPWLGQLAWLSDVPWLRDIQWFSDRPWLDSAATRLYLAGAAMFALNLLFIDVNRTSLHTFYRDRLSRAYLFFADRRGRRLQETRRDPDVLPLAELSSSAPYHLVNTTLNLHQSRDRELRDRHSDFFVLSKRHVGGEKTGYARTRDMQAMDPHLNLATAMAISGAAASPSMGAMGGRAFAFILGLLNVRLGYWLPNPLRVREARSTGLRWLRYRIRLRSRAGFSYLLRELFGWLDEESAKVNLSDGGHLENLGIYQLLRRRCKYIIACDAGADPNLEFESLVNLMRYAKIDLGGCDVRIDLDDIRRDEDGYSTSHCALGTIHYGPGETGKLLYVKLSMTGDESEFIRRYRAEHEEFPHQSTVDQFFTEEQFEAYRALGWHIAEELFDRRRRTDGAGRMVEKLFRGLELPLASEPRRRERLPQIGEQRDELERELARHSEAQPPTEPPAELHRLQLLLMEEVFVVLKLADAASRAGEEYVEWRTLFRRWAGARSFRRFFAEHIGGYEESFRAFCAGALDLGATLRWTQVDAFADVGDWTARVEYTDEHGHEQSFPVGSARIGILRVGAGERPRVAILRLNMDYPGRGLLRGSLQSLRVELQRAHGVDVALEVHPRRDEHVAAAERYREVLRQERFSVVLDRKSAAPAVAEADLGGGPA